MGMPAFYITIDTECDNQWIENSVCTTENAKYLPRFQKVCDKYGFKPIYLVDYSMASDQFLCEYLVETQKSGRCEVGMHLHAWNTPPYDKIDSHKKKSYLIEHSLDSMKRKIESMTRIIEKCYGCPPISHRAGRWGINKQYIDCLKAFGYKYDCTMTPNIDWGSSIGYQSGGTNYKKDYLSLMEYCHAIGIVEIPMTIKKMHIFDCDDEKNYIKNTVKSILGKDIWMRPSISSNYEINKLIEKEKRSDIEFMMHSSELMPGGSPYYPTEKAIEKLYNGLEVIFTIVSKNHVGKRFVDIDE